MVCNPARNDPYWHCCDGYECVPHGEQHKCVAVECVSNDNCQGDRPYCHPTQRSCVQCFDNAQCDNACDLDKSTCDPCLNVECPQEVCENGGVILKYECDNGDCVKTDPDAVCPECDDAVEDCRPGEICENGTCVDPCAGIECPDKECEFGGVVTFSCKNGECEQDNIDAKCPECSLDIDCDEGEECWDGTCEPLPCGGPCITTCPHSDVEIIGACHVESDECVYDEDLFADCGKCCSTNSNL